MNFKLKLLVITLISFFLGAFAARGYLVSKLVVNHEFHDLSMDEMRSEYLSEKNEMIGKLVDQGNYKCCLETPCAYCLEKTPGHGENEKCFCLDDVVNGRHPCGECIGEILEGHGNKFLAKYFARAIAEEVGEGHLITLRKIIAQKYGLAEDLQL